MTIAPPHTERITGMTAIVCHGDARALQLPDESVDLIVTSPPYFGLRSYTDNGEHYATQIGAEATPAEFIAALIDCTREMVRVLKPSGSIFVNLGDKYSGTSKRQGMPPKSLMMLPERYRIAAVDDLGLIARAVIVWSKPNGLPESVTDRVRRSHEDWVHLTKRPKYFAAVDEIREPHHPESLRHERQARENGRAPIQRAKAAGVHPAGTTTHNLRPLNTLGKLPGSVWSIATQPLRVPAELNVDHYAAFPMEWPRRIISGWCPPGGVVLDPFGGTGTTALVADTLGRVGISVDASGDYGRIALWRTTDGKQRDRAGQAKPSKPLPLVGPEPEPVEPEPVEPVEPEPVEPEPVEPEPHPDAVPLLDALDDPTTADLPGRDDHLAALRHAATADEVERVRTVLVAALLEHWADASAVAS